MADQVGVYWSLFQGAFPDEWKNDPQFSHYMSQLTSYSIEKLQSEPENLKEEKRLVLNSTQKLAFNNYQAFIGTAECTREVFKEFVAVEDHVSQLLDKIPAFCKGCKTFAAESQAVNSKRKLNSLALSRHTQLLEVLEIPQVMETCVRNGYYEEALDLSAHVRRMNKKHGTIPIIKGIGVDVEACMELMLQQLLQQLRGAIQLPACLRVVGFLRRMDVFSDLELRLKFLQARDSWFQGMLAAVPKDNAYNHLNKTIELSRVHLFDIVTQYRAIFPDDDTVKLSLSSHSLGGGAGGGARETVEGVLFYSWVNEKIWQFLHVLEEDLTRGVEGRLDSLLGQCMYFGLSFGRIGADFRSLVVPVFVRVLLNSFRLALRNGKHEFHEAMKHLALTTPLRGLSTPPTSFPSLSSTLPSPPHTLLDYPPLATLTNALIHAFNGLRQCAPLAGGPEISQELKRLLESTVHDVVEYYRVEREGFSERDVSAYQQLVRVLARDFLPFIKQMFETLYSEERVEQLALTTPYALHHATPSTHAGTRGIGAKPALELRMKLDVAEMCEPLRGVAPEVIREVEEARKKPELLTQQEDSIVMATSVEAEKLVEEKEELVQEEGVLQAEERNAKEGVAEIGTDSPSTTAIPSHLSVSKQDYNKQD